MVLSRGNGVELGKSPIGVELVLTLVTIQRLSAPDSCRPEEAAGANPDLIELYRE